MQSDYSRTRRCWPYDSGYAPSQYLAQLSAYALLILLFFLTACDPSQAPSRFEGTAMTMAYCVQIGDPEPNKEQINSIILSTFTTIDEIYNNWNPESEISQLNALPAYEKKQLSSSLLAFLQRIGEMVQLTEGRFDPTISPIKNRLLRGKIIPDSEGVGWQNIHLEGDFFWKEKGVTALDLSGVAKGYAVDLLVERLEAAGYHHLYVEWGGEIRTAGHHPDHRPWTIAILGGETLELEEGAIATSGSYLQQWIIDEKFYTHIIDPFTKKPLTNTPITSASVLRKSCFEADALATAFMLFSSKEEAYEWAQKHGINIWLF